MKRQLERRVASVCSKPGCGRITAGPHSDPSKSVSVGEAGHITSAAKGGPRYDETLTPEQRRAATNGIWLCCACHEIVDADSSPFSADVLREWKSEAEKRAREAVELAKKRDAMPAFVTLLHRSMELIPDRSLARSMPLLFRHVHEVVADVRAPCARENAVDLRAVVVEHLRARNALWGHLESVPDVELAYYGIAHVPLAIHMGHLLGTRMSVHYAERERDGNVWRWLGESTTPFPDLKVHQPDDLGDTRDVAISVGVSYPVTTHQIVSSVGEMPIVRLAVDAPALDIVRSRTQIEAYSSTFREALERIARVDSISRVHLFAATPMCLSFALGRQVRNTVHPGVYAYNYRRGGVRPYSWRLLMTDDPDAAAQPRHLG
ncbi:SAVED domain-containing protein [Sandaracinus amylolyticus]|uniref:SAVED domain-containing protein n=1 Tax=Sandaracinus amylolyticus TaxID=927083 RepID=UPI00146FE229|nr:SAVED domain-containing protein [Sandaracinus amylolyticus]